MPSCCRWRHAPDWRLVARAAQCVRGTLVPGFDRLGGNWPVCHDRKSLIFLADARRAAVGFGPCSEQLRFRDRELVWCVFLTPDAERGAQLDLVAFEERERRRYLSALIVLELIALGSNVANGLFAAYDNWLSDSAFTVVDLVLTGTALITTWHWLRIATALIILGISSYFLISVTSIIAG
jgi:hypothetical protein